MCSVDTAQGKLLLSAAAAADSMKSVLAVHEEEAPRDCSCSQLP